MHGQCSSENCCQVFKGSLSSQFLCLFYYTQKPKQFMDRIVIQTTFWTQVQRKTGEKCPFLVRVLTCLIFGMLFLMGLWLTLLLSLPKWGGSLCLQQHPISGAEECGAQKHSVCLYVNVLWRCPIQTCVRDVTWNTCYMWASSTFLDIFSLERCF